MAPHSSTLAWKIPWMEEPGRLQSMGSLRVGHDWATSLLCIGEGNGNPLQCSCLENPRDRRVWWAAVYGVAQSQTRLKRLSSSSSTLQCCVSSYCTAKWVSHTCVCARMSSLVWLFVTLWTIGRLLCPWDSPGKNTGVGCMPSSRGSSRLRDWTHVSMSPAWQADFLSLSHLGSPKTDLSVLFVLRNFL